jgi:hypothetical protein
LELNIEIWDQAGNANKENQARVRMRKVLDILQELINQMNEGRGMERLDPEIQKEQRI